MRAEILLPTSAPEERETLRFYRRTKEPPPKPRTRTSESSEPPPPTLHPKRPLSPSRAQFPVRLARRDSGPEVVPGEGRSSDGVFLPPENPILDPFRPSSGRSEKGLSSKYLTPPERYGGWSLPEPDLQGRDGGRWKTDSYPVPEKS